MHAAQTTHPAHEAALQFAKRVEARTGGQVKIEIYPAAQLGSETEMAQKIRLGTVDMAASSLNYLIKYEKAFAVVIMPYQFDSYEHAHRVLDGPAMKWLAPLAEVMQYQSQLKSVTGGQGSFVMELSHYEPVPPQVQAQVVAAYKPKVEEE